MSFTTLSARKFSLLLDVRYACVGDIARVHFDPGIGGTFFLALKDENTYANDITTQAGFCAF